MRRATSLLLVAACWSLAAAVDAGGSSRQHTPHNRRLLSAPIHDLGGRRIELRSQSDLVVSAGLPARLASLPAAARAPGRPTIAQARPPHPLWVRGLRVGPLRVPCAVRLSWEQHLGSACRMAVYRLKAGRWRIASEGRYRAETPLRAFLGVAYSRSGTAFLAAIESTGFGRTVIWCLDGRPFRPRLVARIPGGTTGQLARGLVVEHDMAKYVYGFPLPAGVEPGDAMVRTWRYSTSRRRFTPGRWQRLGNARG